MTTFDKLKFRLWDSLDTIEGLVRRWEPGVLPDESSYELSLYDFLHNELPGFQITRQYGRDRFKVDIAIEEAVAIEIKHNLTSIADYQRLVGQLVEYGRWRMAFVLVLTGQLDQDIVQRVRRELKQHFRSWGTDDSARLALKGTLPAPDPTP